jgi:probable selenium-dependent hydroxylase accessory protein YqeC
VILRALGITRGDVVAVAGAGGKTTLVYRLADEARSCGLTVLVTTTTHMGTLDDSVTGPVLVEADGDPSSALVDALAREGRVTLLGRRVRPDKLEGVTAARVDALAALADLVLVEADGARGRSLKVPAPHEPVIPLSTTVVVVVCALDALGQPLDDEHVHRVELVRAATGVDPGEVVDEDCLVTALRHADGYPSRVPPRARAGVFLNKAEDDEALAVGERLAVRLIPPYRWVAAGSARSGTVRTWPPMRRTVR